ncbi:hypothetical protein RZS08_50420, partial [Arthrospira platensis SPKY1]|nr:hypothetical protein [Arthrospira platensis SPKY1]
MQHVIGIGDQGAVVGVLAGESGGGDVAVRELQPGAFMRHGGHLVRARALGDADRSFGGAHRQQRSE